MKEKDSWKSETEHRQREMERERTGREIANSRHRQKEREAWR
jgi:hypothetical protein